MSGWRQVTDADVGKTMLVSNNFSARNAHGEMSHRWIIWIQKTADGEYMGFDQGVQRIWGITHCAELPNPDRPDDPVAVARECFLSMLADAGEEFREDVDGDADGDGRQVITVTYHLESGSSQFEELCEALGIKGPTFYDDSWMVAIQRAIEAPPVQP